jgi:glycosyltransferase involved in cell wall biosynthesis
MKVLHIVNDLKRGGLQKFVLSLSFEASKHDNNVKILVLTESKDIFTETDGAEIIQCKCKSLLSKFYAIIKYVKIYEPNVVHTHGITLFLSMFSIFLNYRKIKYIHTIHNLAAIESGSARRSINKVLFKLFKVTPVTISNEVNDSFLSEYKGIKAYKILNGCSSTNETIKLNETKRKIVSLKRNSNTKVIVNVGRIDYQKNQSLLIDSFNEIKYQRDVILIILGGPLNESNKFYSELKAKDLTYVYFLSEVENVVDYLLCSQIFCLSSRFEGLPISLLEAMSQGLTCVGTPAGGVSSVINSDIGYVSNGFNVDELAQALTAAIDKPKNLVNIKEEFRLNYSMGICYENYLKAYKNE